jgi:hypothetical protein
MEFVGLLFIGKPLRSAAVAAGFLLLYAALRRRGDGTHAASRWPLAAAGAWLAYAAWEWLILARTPEANIRVDLLVIYPALAVVTLWALFRSIRPARTH